MVLRLRGGSDEDLILNVFINNTFDKMMKMDVCPFNEIEETMRTRYGVISGMSIMRGDKIYSRFKTLLPGEYNVYITTCASAVTKGICCCSE